MVPRARGGCPSTSFRGPDCTRFDPQRRLSLCSRRCWRMKPLRHAHPLIAVHSCTPAVPRRPCSPLLAHISFLRRDLRPRRIRASRPRFPCDWLPSAKYSRGPALRSRLAMSMHTSHVYSHAYSRGSHVKCLRTHYTLVCAQQRDGTLSPIDIEVGMGMRVVRTRTRTHT